MELKSTRTADGSLTYYHPLIGEHYHSIHGALQESRHVFLDTGARHYLKQHPEKNDLHILEVGFGTGLNFLLSADYCQQEGIKLHYCGIEKYPLSKDQLMQTAYAQHLQDPGIAQALYTQYAPETQAEQVLHPLLCLDLKVCDVRSFTSTRHFDLLYFDAFAVNHQPEMWEKDTLWQVCQYLKPGGILVTYAITGNLKRNLKALGFTIEKLPGAPGKREMLRATRSAFPSYPQNGHNNPEDPR